MLPKITILLFLLHSVLVANSINLKTLNGAWHMQYLDGKDVRKARAILEFDAKKMHLSGFDACNQIEGLLVKNSSSYTVKSMQIRTMPCRQSIHRRVKRYLHKVLKHPFTLKKVTHNGIKGLLIQSKKHKLFFKHMGERSWGFGLL
jgi:heat shock protein HslJ